MGTVAYITNEGALVRINQVNRHSDVVTFGMEVVIQVTSFVVITIGVAVDGYMEWAVFVFCIEGEKCVSIFWIHRSYS